jgi:hypothetical protein
LNQQEFESVSRWLPLLSVEFLLNQMDAVECCHRIAEHLSRYKKLKRRHDELLHEYWRSAWQIAHLTMLLGSDGGATLRRLFERLDPEFPDCALGLPWTLVRLGISSFALRGAWVASKMPALIVPPAKRRYVAEEVTFLSSLTDGLCLSAIGLRHRRYQAEVRKTLGKVTRPLADATGYHDIVHHFAEVYFDTNVANPNVCLDHTIDISRRLLRALYEHLPEPQVKALDDVPDDVAVALFLKIPHDIYYEGGAVVRSLFERLTWVVSVEAKSFYLPEPYDVLGRIPWTRDDGLLLLRGRKDARLMGPKPVVKGPKIGRNAECPCGSGKKYKRCCGGPQAAS